jgi:chromosome partitioning protein
MGTVYAIANQKGGVGKTTTAVNVAACIAEAGFRTLLVDIDPQANATLGLGVAKDTEPNIYDVLAGRCDVEEALADTTIERLKLVPAHPDLAGANIELPREPGSETRLRDALTATRERFDYLLLDCPPSLGMLTLNALIAAESLLVPLQCEFFALEGLSQLLTTVERVRGRFNPQLFILGVALTMFDRRNRLTDQVSDDVREVLGPVVFETVIPRNVRLSEAPSHGLPALIYDHRCAGSAAYIALARELLGRLPNVRKAA